MTRAILIAIIIAAASNAHTPLPFQGERLFLDSIASAANGKMEGVALDALESVAEGRPIDNERARKLPGGSYLPPSPAFTSPTIRAYALRKIGRVPSEKARLYLENLTPAALGPDTSGEIHQAAAIARQTAIIDRLQGHAAQIEYLEKLAQQKDKAPWFGVRSWAVEELCNIGGISSLPVLEKVFNETWGGQSEEKFESCAARVRIVAASDNRAQALGAVLQVRQNPNLDLMFWAVGQLIDMKTEDAERELDRFWMASGGDLKLDDQSAAAIHSVRENVRRHREWRAAWSGVQ